MALRAFKKGFRDMMKRRWDKIYVFIDLHSTIVKPNFRTDNIPTEFYPHAKEAMQLISKRKDLCLIMWTCSHQHEIDRYLKFFKKHDIHFEYVNENPEVETKEQGYGCYDKKPYMNVLMDDKSGFDADNDWEGILEFIESMPEINYETMKFY